MTVESLQTKQIYEGNGAATEFPVPFSYNQTDTLKLIFTSAAGEDVEVTENFRVNVSGDGDTSITYPVEGDPIPAGTRLTIYRQTPLTQIVDLIYGGAFNPDVLEHDALDRITMMVQELAERTERSLQWPITTDQDDMETPGEYLAQVNAARDVAVSAAASAGAASSDSAASAGASGAAASAAAVSAAEVRAIADNFMENVPLVDDAHNGAVPKFGGVPRGSLTYVGADGIEYGSLLPRPATQEEVNTGEIDPEQPEWTQPFVGVGEHAAAHKSTKLVATDSAFSFTVPAAGGFLWGLLVSGGNSGQGSRRTSTTDFAGGAGGNSGVCSLLSPIAVYEGQIITVNVGGGGAASGASSGTPAINIGGDSAVYVDGVLAASTLGQPRSGGGTSSVYGTSNVYGASGTRAESALAINSTAGIAQNSGGTNSRVHGGGGGGGYIIPGLDLTPPQASNGGWGYGNQGSPGTGGNGWGAGGGGGGAYYSNIQGNGGAGAQGIIVLWFTQTPALTEE